MSQQRAFHSCETVASPTLPARFWPKVEKTETCWLWTAATDNGGYGTIGAGGRGAPKLRAHRVAYELLVGPIPEGLQLDHLCRVRACVNPAHLEPVTQQENIRRGEKRARPTCIRGHELAGENVTTGDRGSRKCRECGRERSRARTAARRMYGPGSGCHQAAKTHCPQGHPYDAVNTYTDRRGRRSCKECGRARVRAHRELNASREAVPS